MSQWEVVAPRTYLQEVAANPPPGMYSMQATLPRLPVPDLDGTLDKYLKSVEPVLTPEELVATRAAVEEFRKPDGIGRRTQEKLLALEASLAPAGEKSWLEDIWLQYAYHIWRDPIVVTSNWYSVFRASPAALSHDVKQVSRATAMVSNMVQYRNLVLKEASPIDKVRGKPLCMDQYSKIFGVTRIPGEHCDSLRHVAFSESRHIVVMRRDQMFAIDVVDERDEPIDELILQAQLEYVMTSTDYACDQPPIPILTGEQRTTWWRAREAIRTLSERNAGNLDVIERAMFAVALDDASPSTREEMARLLFHNYSGRNRFYDKSFTLVFFANGWSGINAEHSPIDAPSLAHGGALFVSYMESVAQYVRLHASAGKGERPRGVGVPKKLVWDVDEVISEAIAKALVNVAAFIAPYQLNVLEFTDYGFEEIRKIKVSPDAFVQMAIQLAYYKAHGKCVPTYESAQTRMFFHGRTENVRTLSNETVEFVKTMEDKAADNDTKLAALTRAVNGHVAYMVDSSTGKGADRHLLALRVLIGQSGEQQPIIFTDPAFSKSMHFQLSTSNLTPAPEFFGGYGPMYNDGYGVCYALRPYGLWFSVTAHGSCPTTSAPLLIEALKSSLADIRALFVQKSQL